MTITTKTIHTVTTIVPDDVWINYGNTIGYQHKINACNKGNVSAGSNHYTENEEWAEFHDLPLAIRCETMMKEMIEDYQKELARDRADYWADKERQSDQDWRDGL